MANRSRSELRAFIKANAEPGESLGAFTGQDHRALEAFAACAQLYAVADEMGRFHARAAMAILLLTAQQHVRRTFRLALAFALDWPEAGPAGLWGAILVRAEDHPPEADHCTPARRPDGALVKDCAICIRRRIREVGS